MVVGLAPDAARLEEAIRHAREALRDLPGVVPIWQQHVHSSADLRNISVLLTESPIQQSRVAAFPAPILRSAAQGRRVRAGLRGREPQYLANTSARGAGPQWHLCSFPQIAHARSRLPPAACASAPRTARRRSGWPLRLLDAGPVVRHWHWPQTKMILDSVPTRNAITLSCSATTLVASSRP